MSELLDVAERMWTGALSTTARHPVDVGRGLPSLDEVAARTAVVPALGTVNVLDTDGGLVLVDTGPAGTAEHVHEQVRQWTQRPVALIVYSHGHVDHVGGVGPFDTEAERAGRPAPTVVAHRDVPRRFDRYRLTAGWNGHINARQFGLYGVEPHWPTDYRYPDRTYDDVHRIEVGGETIELHHARGETDDHTWTWVPGRRLLCTGDLFIWAVPNAGNPQKVQRYPREWVEALTAMAALEPEVLLPGHGVPIVGADRIRQALGDTAELLQDLHDQVVDGMNRGVRLDDLLHDVRVPDHLADRPYLQPVYDDPEFIVRTVWREYGGWWDGNPATLKPAPEAELAREVAILAGGADRVAARAAELAEAGHDRLAGHLAEWAVRAAPDRSDVHDVRAEVFEARRDAEPSTMARGIFGAAAAASRRGELG